MMCRCTSGMATCPPCVCPDSVSATRAGTAGKTSGSCESSSTASSGGTAASAPAMSAPRLRSSETPATQSPGPAGTASSSSTGRPTPAIASAMRRPPAYQSWLPRTATTPRGAPSGASRAASASAPPGRVNVAFWSMKSPSRQTRSGASPITASTACEIAPSVACGTPACRSATIPTRSPSSAAGQAGSANVSRRTTRRRGSTHKDQTPRAPAAPGAPAAPAPPSLRRLLLVVVGAAADVAEVAEVVEAAPGGAEARPDLLELGRVERRAEALEPLAVIEPELGRQVVALEQADVVDPAGERLGRLDLDRPVALQARGRRDELPDDHVLLQPGQAVDLALERGVGQHLRGLLEGGRREERVRGQRRLGDAEDDLGVHRGLAALGLDAVVDPAELVPVHELARQQVRVALLLDPHLLEHLAHDQLDVLVVDVHALRLVDLLHLLDEVHLGRGAAAELEQLVRVQRALVELLAGLDDLALAHVQARPARERVAVLLARLVGDDHGAGLVGVLHRDGAADLGDLRQALRLAGLEELNDARQAVRDVRAGDAAGVERPHGQLGARLADRLGGHDAHRVADHGRLAGGQRAAVALLAHAGGRLALEHGADRDPEPGAVGAGRGLVARHDRGQLVAADLVALGDDELLADVDVG